MSTDDFGPDDQAILDQLGIGHDEETGPQAGEQPSEQAAATTQPTTEAQQTQPAEDQDAGHKGNVNHALRAARRAERRAKEETARLAQELEQLRAKVPKASADAVDDDLTDIAQDFPAAAEIIKRERAARIEAERKATELSQAKATAQPADPDFEPQAFDEDTQAAIDAVPDLMAWQYDPAKQQEFALAKSVDAMLQQHPKWAGKPLAERFQEVVRRVRAETGDTQAVAPSARQAAAAAINAAPRRTPETLSDLGGGAATKNASNLSRYTQMSDDDILADLDRAG